MGWFSEPEFRHRTLATASCGRGKVYTWRDMIDPASVPSGIAVMLSFTDAALLVIDVQKAIDADYHAAEDRKSVV